MSDSEYIIKGDVDGLGGGLVYVCGSSLDTAQRSLERMLNNPNENDKKLIARHTNLRIKEVPKEECWWNGNCDLLSEVKLYE